MTKRMLPIILTLFSISCFAQRLQVKSFEGQHPLAFASVFNLSKGQLYFTDEQGALSSNFEVGDSVFITYVGYQSMRAQIVKAEQTFFLKQSTEMLEPVLVSACKYGRKREYSNLVADTGERKFGGVCCWRKGASNKVAVMLKPGFNGARMEAFSIWLNRAWGAPKHAIRTPILFSFYSIDETTMLPGELLSNKQVIYYPKKDGKQTIKLDSLRLRIPAAGLYLCIEFVHNEKYEWPVRHVDSTRGVDTTYIEYGSMIGGVSSKDFMLAFYNYEKNNWSFGLNRDKEAIYKVKGTIKFTAELGVCKD